MNLENDTIDIALSPNQETESSDIPTIVAERSEPGQENAPDRPALFGNQGQTPQHDLTKTSAQPKAQRKTGKSAQNKDQQMTGFHANISYTTRKGVPKTAYMFYSANSQKEAETEMRKKIMSNGLRQAKTIDKIEWLDAAPKGTAGTKQPKARATAQPAAATANKGNSKTGARSASQGSARSTNKGVTVQRRQTKSFAGVRNATPEPAIRLGILNIIPAAFAAAAGLGYGLGKGMFSRKD